MENNRIKKPLVRLPKTRRVQSVLPKDGSSFGVEAILNTFDQQRVKELADVLHRCGRILRPVNAELWRGFFRGLREKGIAKERIRKVLLWFMEHIRDEGVPMVRSARSFARLFFTIEKRSKQPGTSGLVSNTALAIADALTAARQWPGDSVKQLPTTVQASMDNYELFLQTLEAVIQQLKDNGEGKVSLSMKHRTLLCMEEIQNRLPPVGTFVTQYMERIHKMVWDWKAWSHNLFQLAFTSRRPSFIMFISNTIAMHTHEIAQRSTVLELLGIETDEDRQS